MNKNIFSCIFFAISFSMLACSCQSNSASGQKKSDIPSIELLSLDSSSVFQTNTLSKKKPVVLLFFNTTCDHCQKEAADLVKNKEDLKKIQLVMISTENLNAIRIFYEQYSLSEINKLIIGKDFHYAGINFFKYESVPYCAIYSREHLYLDSLERDFNAQAILQKLKKRGEL